MTSLKFRYRHRSKQTGVIAVDVLTMEQIEAGFLREFDAEHWEFLSRDEWIGLRDKHGTEIFEGDIITYAPTPGIAPFDKGQVVWDLAGFSIRSSSGAVDPFPWEWTGAAHREELWEVVGNVHLNPELLPQAA